MGEPEPNDAPQGARDSAALRALTGDLVRRAREDGAAGAPRQDSTDWSAAEREVLALLADQRAGHEAVRARLAEQAAHDIARLAPPAFDAGAACAQAEVELRLVAGRLAPDVAEAAARARLAQRQLESFREAHNLARPAIYPASRVLQAGLLLLAAGFESVFSAALFAETDERGLIGGAMVALGLSGANVTLGFLAGFLGLRYLGAREPLARSIGAAGLLVLTGLSISLNLFAARWRDTLTATSQDPLAALDAAQWFGLASPQAVILLMLGGGVWIFSALKGYSGFDDPYPDYGKFDRAARDLREAADLRRARARAELEAPVTKAKDALSAQLAQIEQAAARVRTRYDEASAAIQALDRDARRGGRRRNDPALSPRKSRRPQRRSGASLFR
jgi:hypothetical protein